MITLLQLFMAFVILILGLKIIMKFNEPKTIGEGFRGYQYGGSGCHCDGD
tara:strand:+ start:6427 stop:6576 length:150 start_codon:yes stop_codon:yes gene_type:complete